MTKSLTMKRNPFFLPSGFEPQEQINIIEATGDNKKRLEKIKGRKKVEKKLLKHSKHNRGAATLDNIIKLGRKILDIQTEEKEKPDQIQRGFDLATKWGWDGINRPYTPKIISVFGGSKRKKG